MQKRESRKRVDDFKKIKFKKRSKKRADDIFICPPKRKKLKAKERKRKFIEAYINACLAQT